MFPILNFAVERKWDFRDSKDKSDMKNLKKKMNENLWFSRQEKHSDKIDLVVVNAMVKSAISNPIKPNFKFTTDDCKSLIKLVVKMSVDIIGRYPLTTAQKESFVAALNTLKKYVD